MKKILLAIALISFLAVLAGPVITLATLPAPVEGCTIRRAIVVPGLICPAVGAFCRYDSVVYNCVACCLLDKIYTFTYWFFAIAIALAIIFALWGGFLLMTAAGEAEKVATGRKWIMWAIIGIAIALIARAIPAIVRALMV